jgi:hypothetical protein
VIRVTESAQDGGGRETAKLDALFGGRRSVLSRSDRCRDGKSLIYSPLLMAPVRSSAGYAQLERTSSHFPIQRSALWLMKCGIETEANFIPVTAADEFLVGGAP